MLYAIQTGLVSCVIAIKRAGLLFSIVIGVVFFRERRFGIRLIGGGLMASGVFFILLSQSMREIVLTGYKIF